MQLHYILHELARSGVPSIPIVHLPCIGHSAPNAMEIDLRVLPVEGSNAYAWC